jgi:hypothetical protein
VTLSFEGARIDEGAPDHRSTLIQREIDILSVPDLVWDLQVRVNDWPSWQPDISDAAIAGLMRSGALFSWTTGGHTLTARVDIFRVGSLLGWSALDGDVTVIQRWTFTPAGRSVHVAASELRWGEPQVDDASARTHAHEQSLATWLDQLKAEAEART